MRFNALSTSKLPNSQGMFDIISLQYVIKYNNMHYFEHNGRQYSIECVVKELSLAYLPSVQIGNSAYSLEARKDNTDTNKPIYILTYICEIGEGAGG